MIIIAGSSHGELAESISSKLSVPFIKANIKRFEDQEMRIQIDGDLYERDVVIIQATCKPANDRLMELLLIVDAAKRAGARRIITAIPYFGYSRQDRPSYKYGPLSASLVATLIEAAGVNRVLTLDLHSRQTEGFFKVGVQNLNPLSLYEALFPDAQDDGYVVVSPDVGGLTRAQEFSRMLGVDLAVVNKSRITQGQNQGAVQMSEVIGNVVGKKCILVDDIVDSGGTLCRAVELLMEKGAVNVTACITHAVFSKNCVELLDQSPLDKLYITNSIHQDRLPRNAMVLPIDSIFAEAIRMFGKK